MELHPEPSRSASLIVENDNPHHQFQLRSYIDLPFNLKLDSALYYVESSANGDASSYFRLDSRIGWQITDSLDMSIVFQNLLDPEHQEFGHPVTSGLESNDIERSIYGQITWRY